MRWCEPHAVTSEGEGLDVFLLGVLPRGLEGLLLGARWGWDERLRAGGSTGSTRGRAGLLCGRRWTMGHVLCWSSSLLLFRRARSLLCHSALLFLSASPYSSFVSPSCS